MPSYYVNSNDQSTGEHEVHQTTGCSHPAEPESQVPLGDFPNCHHAIEAAKAIYSNVDGCAYCCPDCHTR